MNWTLYGHKGEWVLVDAGSGFAPRDLPAIEAVFPDPTLLKSLLPRLRGLVVTHAHEDHIGAIHRLWPKIKCPIYATPFATKALMARFEERGVDRAVEMKEMEPGGTITVGPFAIRSIRMTHSAPECVSLALKTEVGTIFHTGDWKFDPEPQIGAPTDVAAIQRIGRDGVLAMVCDSTNAERPTGFSSEGDVARGFEKVFRESRGIVVVSCFSTNVARIASAMKAAAATGREVAITGRSLLRNEAIARQLGMLEHVPRPLARASHLRGLDRREMVLICTGAQGEANAALSRLSDGDDWRLPKIGAGDTVIHSARIIPGNEEDVHAVFDGLRARGARVLEREYKGLPLHVTGHATSGEIAEMYGLAKPRFAIPVHGEKAHLEAHAEIARAQGADPFVSSAEGAVLAVDRDGVRKIGQIKMAYCAELGDGSRIAWDEARVRAAIKDAEKERRPAARRRREVAGTNQTELALAV